MDQENDVIISCNDGSQNFENKKVEESNSDKKKSDKKTKDNTAHYEDIKKLNEISADTNHRNDKLSFFVNNTNPDVEQNNEAVLPFKYNKKEHNNESILVTEIETTGVNKNSFEENESLNKNESKAKHNEEMISVKSEKNDLKYESINELIHVNKHSLLDTDIKVINTETVESTFRRKETEKPKVMPEKERNTISILRRNKH